MINLSLPLSATALREGSEFLAKLSQLAEVIRAETAPKGTVGELSYTVSLDTSAAQAELQALSATLDAGVVIPDEAPLNGASGGGDFLEDVETVITQETLPPLQYETVVTGVELNPDYEGNLKGYDLDALKAVNWTEKSLLEQGYLREVTEQRPLAVAPGASPATPPAPPAPAAPGPNTSADVTLDGEGFPWDERIHSNAAEKLSAKGIWKVRKNLAEGYKEKIEAELRAQGYGTTPAAPAAPAPAAPPAPSAPAAPAAPAPGADTRFPQFTTWMMGHVKAQTLDQTKLTLACQKVGLANAAELSKNPDLIDSVKADLIAQYQLAN
jgi:hypothetical protein